LIAVGLKRFVMQLAGKAQFYPAENQWRDNARRRTTFPAATARSPQVLVNAPASLAGIMSPRLTIFQFSGRL